MQLRTPRRVQFSASLVLGSLSLSVIAGGVAVAVADRNDTPHVAATSVAAPSPTTSDVAPQLSPSAVPGSATAASPASSAADASGSTAPAAPAVVHIPKLKALTPPDAVITVTHALPPNTVQTLRRLSGVTGVAVLDRGSVKLPTGRLHVAAVNVGDVRGFTPTLTAKSTALWKSVARGELTVAYSDTRHLRHKLGATLPASGRHGKSGSLRIGAFASVGLPGVQAVVSSAAGRALGLDASHQVLLAAPKISLDDIQADVKRSLGTAGVKVKITRPAVVNQNISSSYALASIPPSYLDLYRRAAVTCQGLPWTVLAAIGTVETGNGSNVHRSTAGAEGPMQFLPSTWKMYGVDADGDGKANIQDPTDAVFAAARYLCAAGASRGGQALADSIFSYNHAWWYVREVILIANRYA